MPGTAHHFRMERNITDSTLIMLGTLNRFCYSNNKALAKIEAKSRWVVNSMYFTS
jgi:hypothetical protein